LTPDPYHYDDTKDPINSDHGDAEITPEMGDNYLSAKIMLPRGGTMVRGRVAAQKRDQDGNPIGLANSNPILDTRFKVVHFDDGDQTELTANMITESLLMILPVLTVSTLPYQVYGQTDVRTTEFLAVIDPR
jgi:hypothetical protein